MNQPINIFEFFFLVTNFIEKLLGEALAISVCLNDTYVYSADVGKLTHFVFASYCHVYTIVYLHMCTIAEIVENGESSSHFPFQFLLFSLSTITFIPIQSVFIAVHFCSVCVCQCFAIEMHNNTLTA